MIKSMYKSNSGITITALVVTIIVLIILAGVGISYLLKDNGIIEESILSKDKAVEAALNEEIALVCHNTKINASTKEYSLQELRKDYENGLASDRFNVGNYKYNDYNLIKITYIGDEIRIPVSLTWFVDEISLNFGTCLVKSEDIGEINSKQTETILNLLGLSADTEKRECTNISYIQSKETEYIDLEFKPDNNTRVVFDGMVIDGDCALFGSRTTKRENSFALQHIASNKYRVTYYNKETELSNKYVKNIRYLFDLNKNELKINGEVVLESKENKFNSDYNLILLGINTQGAIGNTGKVRCYSCLVYDDNTLIRELTPVVDKNGIVCLHNLVYDSNNPETGKEYYYSQSKKLMFGDASVVEQAIDSIGTVSLDSKEKIKYAEDLYNQLDDNIKKDVTNYNVLTEANKTYINLMGYKSISYLESTGEQSIDIGIKANQNTRVVFDGMVVEGDTALFGARESNRINAYTIQLISSGAYRNTYGTVEKVLPNTYVKNTRYIFDMNKGALKINNNTVSETKSSKFETPCNLVLFAINTNGTIGNFGKVRCYSCKVYDDDTLVRDLIPVLDSNLKQCLFDKVESKFYYSSNTKAEFNYEL